MKKSIFYVAFVAITILSVSCSSSSTKQEDTANDSYVTKVSTEYGDLELKGKVKEITIKEYSAHESFGDVVKDDLHRSLKYTFTEDGKVSLEEDHCYGSEEVLWTAVYSHSDDKTNIDYYYGDEFMDKEIITYTKNGDIIRKALYNADGSEKYRYEYVYNEDGLLVQETQYAYNQLWRKKNNFKYDENGLLIEYKEYNENGKLEETKQFEYDELGRKIKEKSKVVYFKNEGISTYTYNKEGDEASRSFVMGDERNELREYTYKYDAKGNYVVKYERGTHPEIEERTIVYY